MRSLTCNDSSYAGTRSGAHYVRLIVTVSAVMILQVGVPAQMSHAPEAPHSHAGSSASAGDAAVLQAAVDSALKDFHSAQSRVLQSERAANSGQDVALAARDATRIALDARERVTVAENALLRFYAARLAQAQADAQSAAARLSAASSGVGALAGPDYASRTRDMIIAQKRLDAATADYNQRQSAYYLTGCYETSRHAFAIPAGMQIKPLPNPSPRKLPVGAMIAGGCLIAFIASTGGYRMAARSRSAPAPGTEPSGPALEHDAMVYDRAWCAREIESLEGLRAVCAEGDVHKILRTMQSSAKRARDRHELAFAAILNRSSELLTPFSQLKHVARKQLSRTERARIEQIVNSLLAELTGLATASVHRLAIAGGSAESDSQAKRIEELERTVKELNRRLEEAARQREDLEQRAASAIAARMSAEAPLNQWEP